MDRKEQLLQLNAWWRSTLGRLVMQIEMDKLIQVFPDIFGYHLVLLGTVNQFNLVEYSVIPYQSVLNPFHKDNDYAKTISGEWESLPLAANSVDVIVAPHTLEISPDPMQVIQEIHRALIPEGRLLLFGFNPYSMWRLKGMFQSQPKSIPWCCQFQSLGAIKRELTHLGFKIIGYDYFLFQPPLHNIKLMEKLGFLNRLSHLGLKGLSGVYFIEAQKKVRGPRALQVDRAAAYKKIKMKKPVAAPTTRVLDEEQV